MRDPGSTPSPAAPDIQRTTRRRIVAAAVWAAPAVSLAAAAPAAAADSSLSTVASMQFLDTRYYTFAYSYVNVFPVVTVMNTSAVLLTHLQLRLYFPTGRFTGTLTNPLGGAPLPRTDVIRSGLQDGWSMVDPAGPTSGNWATDPNNVTLTFVKDSLAPGTTSSMVSVAGGVYSGESSTWRSIDSGAITCSVTADQITGPAVFGALANLGSIYLLHG